MEIILAVLKAIAAFPSIKKAFEGAFAMYLAWIDQKEKERIDIAARSIRNAKTKEEKQKALDDWINAAK